MCPGWWAGLRISARRCLISLRVNAIRVLSGGGGGSFAVITDRKAWARMVRAVQRCHEVQVRTWCSSRAASSLLLAKDSSTLQRRPATLTKARRGTGVGE